MTPTATKLGIVIALAALAATSPRLARADDELPPPPAPSTVTPGIPTPGSTAGGDTLSETQRIINAVQHISVREIDSTQTEMRLDRWFWSAVGADPWVSWEVNDCGEQTGSPADSGRDFPLGVEAKAKWDDGREAFVWIVVGSFQGGVRGRPMLAYASAGRGDKSRSFHSMAQFAKYAQIEGKLEEAVKK